MGLTYTEWLRRENERRFKREIRRRKQRKKLKKNKLNTGLHPKRSTQLKKLEAKNKYKDFRLPHIFCITTEPEKTIAFLNTIYNEIQKNTYPIFLDFTLVEKLGIGAILYLLSLLADLKYRSIPFILKGNYPNNQACKKLICASGFHRYIKSGNMDNYDANIISIKSGSDADPKLVKEICDFVLSKFNMAEDFKKYTMPLYDMIVELILNTVQHAYPTAKAETFDSWYIFCRYLADNENIEFTFLDIGAGIPETINKTKMESLKNWLGKMKINFDDRLQSDILMSALEGAYDRTQTKMKNRGKGLPMIKKMIDSNYIQNVFIISDKAFFHMNVQNDNRVAFKGTLFNWEINKDGITKWK